MILGIDLGTTYSLVSVLQHGEPCVLENSLGESLTPSAVSVLDDGRWVVGAPARARLVTHPEATIAAFKRDMGTAQTYELGGRTMTPTALSAMVLRRLKEDAAAALGQEIERAVISVPAYFGELQRAATRDAGEIAGLEVVRLIAEPTAAAIAYGLHNGGREQRIAVLDLGGGTFDVTLLESIEGVIEVQATAGDARLGGEDFLDALAARVRRQVEDARGIDLFRDRRAWSLVRELCEAAKRRLSEVESTSIAHPELRVGDASFELSMELTREAAEDAWRPLIGRLHRVIARALRDARLDPARVDSVLLVGGASRMLCVQALAAQIFGRMPLRALPPDEAVVMGAAVQAGLVDHDAAVDDLIVTDVAPFTLGTSVVGHYSGGGVGDIYSPIIDRGTVIPCSRVSRHITAHNRQSQILIEVFQGEHPQASKNVKLGELQINDLPKRPAGGVSVDVRFTYDLNGLLEVDVSEVESGATVSGLFRGSSAKMSGAEIERARRAMQRLKFDPREALPNTTALARGEALYAERVGGERELLGESIAALRAALDGQDPAQIAAAREELNALIQGFTRGRC